MTALFLDILDTTIVNVAVVPLGEHFHSNKAEWVVLGYTISLAVWIPASGWLGDRFGTKKVFLFALAAFTAGSLLCSLAQSMGQLIAFRVVQGVGGGMLTPVGIAMLYRAFPPSERARAAMIVMIPALCRPGARPGARRPARHPRQLALDLPRQRADRHRRVRLRPGASCASTRRAAPDGSTSPASSSPGRRWR